MSSQNLRKKMLKILQTKLITLKEHGCTQDDMAALLGVSRVTVNTLLNNRLELSVEALEKHLLTLGIDLSFSVEVVTYDIAE